MHHDEGNFTLVGSGCGSVGRAVTSNTIGLHFESSHRQTLYITVSWKDENKEKWLFFKKS